MFDYIVPTGTLIKEYLEVRNISEKTLAEKTNKSEREVFDIINGKTPFTKEFALKLKSVFPDVKTDFWLDFEKMYQSDLKRPKNATKD